MFHSLPSLLSAILILGEIASSNAQSYSNLSSSSYGNLTGINNASSPACPSPGGAHIIVARASLEPPGYGTIGRVKDQILARVPGSTAEYVNYPAAIKPSYIDSETDGLIAMRKLINEFASKCKDNSPLVILGYSQGAQITTDSLVGQNDAGFPANSTVYAPPSDAILSRVAAAIMMGDPSFRLNGTTFHVGNSTQNGRYPTKNLANFHRAGLEGKVQSYCNEGDPFCASGKTLSVHLAYVEEFGNQATNFVVSQIEKFHELSSNVNGTTGGNGGAQSNGNSNSSMPVPYTGAASQSVVFDAASIVPFVLLGTTLASML